MAATTTEVATKRLDDAERVLAADPDLAAALGRLAWVVPGRDYREVLINDVRIVLAYFGRTNAHDQPATADRFTPDATPDELLAAALGRLAWVVPGRNYSDRMIADVRVVLAHFGRTNAHATPAG